MLGAHEEGALDSFPYAFKDLENRLGSARGDCLGLDFERYIIPAINIAREIGKLQFVGTAWDDPASLTTAQWSVLLCSVDQINMQGEQTRVFQRLHDFDPSRPIVLLATDAMKNKGAAVMFSVEGVELDFCLHDFDEQLSINFKETDMGRRGVLWAAQKFPNSDIRLAVDNTTASVGLTRAIFTADDKLQLDLDAMGLQLKHHKCTLTVVQVAGVVIAADERPRGAVSDRSKMKTCADLLSAARTYHWFRELRKRRFRDENPERQH